MEKALYKDLVKDLDLFFSGCGGVLGSRSDEVDLSGDSRAESQGASSVDDWCGHRRC